MPGKYHIRAAPVPNRFPRISRSGILAWPEGCLGCNACVKKACIYGVYSESSDPGQVKGALDYLCQSCFRCIQSCPGRTLYKSLNPEYSALGDAYWTPEIVSGLWYQAETGKIPVSGAGYGGAFAGPGFDEMWTDMSEIVRPTRDGIHGREYINTSVDLGRKPKALEFDGQGRMTTPEASLVEIPLPIVFDLLPWSPLPDRIEQAILEGARQTGTLAVTATAPKEGGHRDHVILLLDDTEPPDRELVAGLKMVEIKDGPEVGARQAQLKEIDPSVVVSIRMTMSSESPYRARQLAEDGAEVLHVLANAWGREADGSGFFIKDRVKGIHLVLVECGMRDQVTLIAGGGIAMAEHVAKLIMCGADAASIDVPLLVAMECRACRRCAEGIECPIHLEDVDPAWGGARIRNLMAGWHSQLLEVLGAMGMREARRLRGEMGRSMLYEDLEREFFSTLTGKRN